jgi:hypothetical protein
VERWWNGYSRKARYIAKLTVVQPVKLCAFYGYRRFGSVFVGACYWFLDSSECSSQLAIFRILRSGGLVVRLGYVSV